MAEMKNLTINGEQFVLPFAPDGYGLGETEAKFLTSADDLNSQNKSGWYHWGENPPANAPTLKYGPNYSFMRVDGANEANFVQTVWSKYGDARGLMVTRVVIGGTPSEWEWGNPPMVLGVEYRTTERYKGEPVYAIAFNFGALPNTSASYVQLPAGPYADLKACVFAAAITAEGNYLNIIDSVNNSTVWVKTSGDYSATTAVIYIKYTKS